jgi:hypothetical protein
MSMNLVGASLLAKADFRTLKMQRNVLALS